MKSDILPPNSEFPTRASKCLVAVLVCVHLALLGHLTVQHAPTLNETAHLPAGLAVWKFGTTDLYRVNPPMVRCIAALPVMWTDHVEDWTHYVPGSPRRSEWDVGADFVRANGEESLWLYTLSRWACLPFSVVGLLVCWAWGRELTNAWGGLIAALLWSFSPNILAHGSLITPDIAATSFGLLAAWRFQHWLQSPDWRNVFFAGVSLGLALVSKTYWSILLGLWPLISLGTLWTPLKNSSPRFPPGLNRGGQLAAILLLGGNVLNLGYRFEGTFSPLGKLPFYSRTLSGTHRDLELDPPGNRFAKTWLGHLPVPFPRDYLTGIDLQKHDFEQRHWSYLLGEHRQRGWWYYYLVGLGVKIPLGTWILVLMGVLTGLRSSDSGRFWRQLLPLWGPVLTLFLVASLESGMNRHVRYVFPALPAFYLISARCGTMVPRWIPAIPLGASLLASLLVYPYSLSFFNLAAGGPANGSAILIDSNLDWGQDVKRARDWLVQHPECRPATIAPIAGYRFSDLGLEIPITPPGKPAPGWHLVSVHLLQAPSGSYAHFKKLQPVGRVGWTINIYHVKE